MNVALITASGVGSRMHNNIPKQFITVNDKPVVIYTLESFERHPDIDAIIVVCLEGWDAILRAYIRQSGLEKVQWIVKGGETGQDSIRAGLAELEKHCSGDDIVLIHDGNRPLVPQSVITDAIVTCAKYGSAVAYIPCTEVVYQKDAGEELRSRTTIDRDTLLRTQTPHAFSLGKLLAMYRKADDRGVPQQVAACALLSLLGEDVHFSMGSELNFKITTQDDLEIFRALLAADSRKRV